MKLLLTVGSVVVTLALCEVGLALFWPVAHAVERNMVFESDPHTGYRLRPGGQGFFADGVTANANRHGHRSPDIAVEKAPGVYRVLVLGDSVSVGASVEQSEAWPSLLEALLTRETGRRVEVINASVGGWQPFQYAQYFEHRGAAFEPDLVLVGLFVGNDLDVVDDVDRLPTAVMGRRVSRDGADAPFLRLRVALLEHSHLARWIARPRGERFSYRRERCDELPTFTMRIQRGRRDVHARHSVGLVSKTSLAAQQLVRIQERAARLGAEMLVLLLPDENQINPVLRAPLLARPEDYDLALPQSLLAARFEKRGIAHLDLLPAFLADERCLFQNDTHWTPEGHALVARQVLEAVAPRVPEK